MQQRDIYIYIYRERERRKRQSKIATHIIDEERKGERERWTNTVMMIV